MMQYKLSMGEKNKDKMRQMVAKSLDNDWKMWLTQVAELQLLWADHENRKNQDQGFFKLDEAASAIIQEELANDIYDLSMRHRVEITKLMEEYENVQMFVLVELDAYENERCQKTWELEENDDNEPTQDEFGQTVPISDAHQEEEIEKEEPETESTL